MHIVYDPQIFSLQTYGGISRYFFETARHVAAMSGVHVSLLAFAHINAYLKSGGQAAVRGWRLPAPPERSRPLLLGANRLLARGWLGRYGADIVHETYYSSARTGPASIPSVVTVFDMIHEKFPEFAPRTEKITAAKRAAVRHADHIICISENTRRDLLEIYDVDPARTSVVRLGFSLQVDHGKNLQRPLPEPYVLFVGKRGGYKNFETLLKAYAAAPALSKSFLLVCFGDAGFSPSELRLAGKLGLSPDRMRHVTGDDTRLAAYYRHASLFVYPSHYEGFGIPPLEAMSLDCPVVCSDAASLPEVVGEAACTFDPSDPDALRTAMERVLDSPEIAARLRRLGRQQVARFSWSLCAEQTLAAYAAVVQ